METLKRHVHELDLLRTEKDIVMKTSQSAISDMQDTLDKKKIELIVHQHEAESVKEAMRQEESYLLHLKTAFEIKMTESQKRQA